MKSIPVFSLPELDPSEEAKIQLAAYAVELHEKAANAHVEGMHLEAQATRVSILLEVATPEDLIKSRDRFVAEGLMQVEKVEVVPMTKGGDA